MPVRSIQKLEFQFDILPKVVFLNLMVCFLEAGVPPIELAILYRQKLAQYSELMGILSKCPG